MRVLRPREVKQFAQGHRASKLKDHDSTPEAELIATMLYCLPTFDVKHLQVEAQRGKYIIYPSNRYLLC